MHEENNENWTEEYKKISDAYADIVSIINWYDAWNEPLIFPGEVITARLSAANDCIHEISKIASRACNNYSRRQTQLTWDLQGILA